MAISAIGRQSHLAFSGPRLRQQAKDAEDRANSGAPIDVTRTSGGLGGGRGGRRERGRRGGKGGREGRSGRSSSRTFDSE